MSPTLLAALKTLHIIAAVLFAGNVIVTGIRANLCFRARDTHDFRLAARAIVVTELTNNLCAFSPGPSSRRSRSS